MRFYIVRPFAPNLRTNVYAGHLSCEVANEKLNKSTSINHSCFFCNCFKSCWIKPVYNIYLNNMYQCCHPNWLPQLVPSTSSNLVLRVRWRLCIKMTVNKRSKWETAESIINLHFSSVCLTNYTYERSIWLSEKKLAFPSICRVFKLKYLRPFRRG